MYDIEKIRPTIVALVGWRQQGQHTPSPLLQKSTSTLYHQDTHPLVSLPNLAATIERGGGETLDAVLTQLSETAAVVVVERVLQAKKLAGQTKTLFQDIRLFEGAGDIQDTEMKLGRFVGISIKTKNMRQLAVRIRQIGTQFTQAQQAQGLKLYVYHSSQQLPVAEVELQHNSPYSFKWNTLTEDLVLEHSSEDYAPGGTYYIGYRESELVGQAVKEMKYKWGQVPCPTCSNYNRVSYQQWSPMMEIVPFSVPETELGANNERWTGDVVTRETGTNFGLNLALSVECDISSYINTHAKLFTHAYALAVAEKALQRMAYSVENSAVSEKLRMAAMFELNNKPEHTAGVTKQLEKAIEAVGFDISGMNSRCLPHMQNKTIRTTSIR